MIFLHYIDDLMLQFFCFREQKRNMSLKNLNIAPQPLQNDYFTRTVV